MYVAHGQTLSLKVLHTPSLGGVSQHAGAPALDFPLWQLAFLLSFSCGCGHYLSSCWARSSKAAHPVSILLTILSVEHEETFRWEEGRESHSGFGVPDPSWLCQKGPHYSPELHPVLTTPRCLLKAQFHSSLCRPVASIVCQNSPMEEIVGCLEMFLYPNWNLCFQW